uniref:N-acetylgalactosaminide beta-1,3-galactosyltransferase n=1 Tax=Macrostomum lignano TaxID=282301 RepID=A0A1I8FWR8_9PLAT
VAAPEGRAHLWRKVRLAFQFAGAHLLADFDYFLKADVDTFVLMPNLRSFLLSLGRRPDSAWWTGRLLRLRLGTPQRWRWQRYMSGGAGYALSRGAVRNLLADRAGKDCGTVTSEDVNMGEPGRHVHCASFCCESSAASRGCAWMLAQLLWTAGGICMERRGVEFADSFDPGSEGGERFHPMSFASHLDFGAAPTTHWLWQYSVRPVRSGLRCCSSSSISFHYVSPQEMRTFHFLLYTLRRGRWPVPCSRLLCL